jgi:hypothetical protein
MGSGVRIGRATFLTLGATTVAATLSGCGGDDDEPAPGGRGGGGGTAGNATSGGGGVAGSATSGGGGVASGGGGSGTRMCQQGALSAVELPGASHVHSLLITAMGINMGTTTYTAAAGGLQTHLHAVILTPEELATLREGGTVTKTTAMDSTDHTHTYEIECTP